MDVIGGLTAAKLALDLAKDLREIDKSVDQASYKMKIAELMSALADTQLAFAEAKSQISNLEAELDILKNGFPCPKCRSGKIEVISVEPALYNTGVEFHKCICTNDSCDYVTDRMFDSSLWVYSSNKPNKK